uniref:Uncharacterized protein n=1 Tax=Anguilla anguilla TaxID=7936 RepID=A0A0E9WBH3_ANGAN
MPFSCVVLFVSRKMQPLPMRFVRL